MDHDIAFKLTNKDGKVSELYQKICFAGYTQYFPKSQCVDLFIRDWWNDKEANEMAAAVESEPRKLVHWYLDRITEFGFDFEPTKEVDAGSNPYDVALEGGFRVKTLDYSVTWSLARLTAIRYIQEAFNIICNFYYLSEIVHKDRKKSTDDYWHMLGISHTQAKMFPSDVSLNFHYYVPTGHGLFLQAGEVYDLTGCLKSWKQDRSQYPRIHSGCLSHMLFSPYTADQWRGVDAGRAIKLFNQWKGWVDESVAT